MTFYRGNYDDATQKGRGAVAESSGISELWYGEGSLEALS